MAIVMAQYGMKHGHAAGKALAMRSNPDVTLAGIFEPDEALGSLLETAPAYAGVRRYRSAAELLGDPSVVAVAIEGRNDESLAMAREALDAGKHLWFDKPAGDDLDGFRSLIDDAGKRHIHVQMGYMFRYHHGFRQIAAWAEAGVLGELFAVRAHMSTWITVPARQVIARHRGGIFYDLGGHMLDQVVWLLGRPTEVSAFFRNDVTSDVPAFADNTIGIFGFARAMAYVDIAAVEPRPMARRFEVYGTLGSAILEPFEPARRLRLCLESQAAGWSAGEQVIEVETQSRQEMHEREIAAFVATLEGRQEPDRSLHHELLVQETLLRATQQARR